MRIWKLLAMPALCFVALAGCGGGGGGGGSSSSGGGASGGGTPPSYKVGGYVYGLGAGTNAQLSLRTFSGDQVLATQTVSPTTNGRFDFPTAVPVGTRYEITVTQQPSDGQLCSITASASGTTQSSDFTGVAVTCGPGLTLGGTVFGLRGEGLVIGNGSDTLAISADGTFTFPTQLPRLSEYNVKVITHPSNIRQRCGVSGGAGTMYGNFLNIVVTCSATLQLGTSANDEPRGAGTDSMQNLYVAGRTQGSLDDAPNLGGWDGFVLKFSPGSELIWKRQLRSGGDDNIESMAVTGAGDVYVAGSTTGSLVGINAGDRDIFVAKYDSGGTLQWIRQLGTAGADIAHGVDVGSDGSVYVAGETSGTLAGASAGGVDLFVAKFDTNGTRLWLQQFGTPVADAAYSVAVNSAGTAYVAGGTFGNLDGQSNVTAGEAGFVSVYSSAGNRLYSWLVCQTDCTFSEPLSLRMQTRINSIDVGASGTLYVAGWHRMDPAGDNHYGYRGTIAATFAPTGERRHYSRGWASLFGDTQLNHILASADETRYFTAGNDLQSENHELTAYASGYLLIPPYGSPLADRSDVAGRSEAMAIAQDLQGTIYSVGYTFGAFGANTNLGGSDIYISRYTSGGGKL